MAKMKRYEYRDNRDRRDSDGLKQRRLKDEARWKFNRNETLTEEEDLDDDSLDYDESDQSRQGG